MSSFRDEKEETMEIRGIRFVASHAPAHAETARFLEQVLGLRPITVEGVGAQLFATTNGDVLGVAPPYPDSLVAERTVGLLVDDLDTAVAELHAAGVETDGISANARWRYTHFRTPDGRLYELVEERG
jgi:glyoxylase I family protein